MMTTEEARALAQLVVAGKPRSHVEAARSLAQYVLASTPILRVKEHAPDCSASRLGPIAACDCGAETF